MRDLVINQQKIYFSLYLGKVMQEDSNGKKTGTYSLRYSDPTMCYVSVSAAQGSSDTREFGEFNDYDKTLNTTQKLPIEELTRLWIDDLDTTKPHDYEVTKVAKSLNQYKYAIKKVKVKN